MLDTNGAVNKILEIVDDSSVEQILNDIVELVDSTNQKLDDANALLNSIKQNSDYYCIWQSDYTY